MFWAQLGNFRETANFILGSSLVGRLFETRLLSRSTNMNYSERRKTREIQSKNIQQFQSFKNKFKRLAPILKIKKRIELFNFLKNYLEKIAEKKKKSYEDD